MTADKVGGHFGFAAAAGVGLALLETGCVWLLSGSAFVFVYLALFSVLSALTIALVATRRSETASIAPAVAVAVPDSALEGRVSGLRAELEYCGHRETGTVISAIDRDTQRAGRIRLDSFRRFIS